MHSSIRFKEGHNNAWNDVGIVLCKVGYLSNYNVELFISSDSGTIIKI